MLKRMDLSQGVFLSHYQEKPLLANKQAQLWLKKNKMQAQHLIPTEQLQVGKVNTSSSKSIKIRLPP